MAEKRRMKTTDIPRIESLSVKNYRALRKVELDNLTPMTVLLGPNGSGKSTVFRCLAQAQKHTQGCIEVPANAETGYCPQSNVVCNKLTVEETLLLFAKVKHEGVMKSMGLEKIKNKLVGILSGGNKRKL